MPELKLFKQVNFEPVQMDISKIRFQDKTREKQRQANLKRRALEPKPERPQKPKKAENAPWSEKVARKERRQERRDKKEKKKEAIKRATVMPRPDSGDDLDDIEDDYKSLMMEKRLGKRLKSGQISKEDFARALNAADSDSNGSGQSD